MENISSDRVVFKNFYWYFRISEILQISILLCCAISFNIGGFFYEIFSFSIPFFFVSFNLIFLLIKFKKIPTRHLIYLLSFKIFFLILFLIYLFLPLGFFNKKFDFNASDLFFCSFAYILFFVNVICYIVYETKIRKKYFTSPFIARKYKDKSNRNDFQPSDRPNSFALNNVQKSNFASQQFIVTVVCIFFGFFGIHRFICRKNNSGFFQLLIFPICCGVVFPLLIFSPWMAIILLFPFLWWFFDLILIISSVWNFEDFVFNK